MRDRRVRCLRADGNSSARLQCGRPRSECAAVIELACRTAAYQRAGTSRSAGQWLATLDAGQQSRAARAGLAARLVLPSFIHDAALSVLWRCLSMSRCTRSGDTSSCSRRAASICIEQLVTEMNADPDWSRCFLRALEIEALCGHRLRRIADNSGGMLLDWQLRIGAGLGRARNPRFHRSSPCALRAAGDVALRCGDLQRQHDAWAGDRRQPGGPGPDAARHSRGEPALSAPGSCRTRCAGTRPRCSTAGAPVKRAGAVGARSLPIRGLTSPGRRCVLPGGPRRRRCAAAAGTAADGRGPTRMPGSTRCGGRRRSLRLPPLPSPSKEKKGGLRRRPPSFGRKRPRLASSHARQLCYQTAPSRSFSI